MLRTNTLRTLPFFAAAAMSVAAFIPSGAEASSGTGGGGQGKVSVHDLSVTHGVARSGTVERSGNLQIAQVGPMSTGAHTGISAFDPAFRGGVVVAAGDVDGDATSSVTDLLIDPFNR